MSRCIAMAGGGTGGHIIPALAVGRELRARAAVELLWIGPPASRDRRLVQSEGIRYHAVPSGKLRRYVSIRNLLDIAKVLGGVVASALILLRTRPVLLFSKGGFASVPPAIAAWLLGIPVVTHECDVTPGLATRINALLARQVLVSFPRTREALPARIRPRVRVTGNPVRAQIQSADADRGRRWAGAPAGVPLLVVTGGSLGAGNLDQVVQGCLDELLRLGFVVHQCGPSFSAPRRAGYRSAPFFHEEFPDLLAAADLVVSRAGANSLAELACLGKPAVLVPLPLSSSRGEQIINAALFERAGAAVVLRQDRLSPATLAGTVRELLGDPERMRAMGASARSLARPEAAGLIAEVLLGEAGARGSAASGGSAGR